MAEGTENKKKHEGKEGNLTKLTINWMKLKCSIK